MGQQNHEETTKETKVELNFAIFSDDYLSNGLINNVTFASIMVSPKSFANAFSKDQTRTKVNPMFKYVYI